MAVNFCESEKFLVVNTINEGENVMKKILFVAFFFVFCTLGFSQIVIDGDLSDWTPAMQIDVLPGVVEETDDFALEKMDIKDVYITNDEDFLYIRIDINENGLLSELGTDPVGWFSLFIDTDMCDTTGLTWGWWAIGADYWMVLNSSGASSSYYPGDSIFAFTGANGSDSKWAGTGYIPTVAYNDDDNVMEVGVPRIALEMEGVPAVGLRFLLLNENTVDWSNEGYPSSWGSDIAAYHYNASITVDGDLSDWTEAMQFDVEPNPLEDVDDYALEKMDIKDVYVAHDLDSIYIRIDINENGLLSELGTDPVCWFSLFLDTDMCDTTGLTWGWWALGADYWMVLNTSGASSSYYPGDGIFAFTGANGSDSQWAITGYTPTVAYNTDDNVIEVGLSRAAIGEVDKFYESLRFLILNENTVDWSNEGYPSSWGSDTAPYYFSSFPPPDTTTVDTTTGIAEHDTYIPEQVNLLGNYPNPFNPNTIISFVLENTDKITLEVFNLLGQKVRTLYSGNASRGMNNIEWDGKDDFDMSVESGVYLYTLTTANTSMSSKMILLK